MFLQAIVLFAVPAVFALGAVTDVISYRIPNWIPGLLLALFAAAAPLSGMQIEAVGLHVAVFVAALVFGMGLFALNVVGGGDAKFFAAVALWMGPAMIAKYTVVFAFVGGAFAVLILVLRRMPLPASASHFPVLGQLLRPTSGMPYGVALGIGALIVLPGTSLFAKALTP